METNELHRLPSLVRVRVVPAAAAGWRELERVSWLTPDEAETIGEDARRAGPGARLEVTVPRLTSETRLAAVMSLIEWLATKGIDVIVREDDDRRSLIAASSGPRPRPRLPAWFRRVEDPLDLRQ